jgi:hypothetical protein
MRNEALMPDIRRDGEAVLAALDAALADHGESRDTKLSDAMRGLVEIRDKLILKKRDGERCGDLLECSNALISSLLGTEFPLGGHHRKRVVETREALGKMLRVDS